MVLRGQDAWRRHPIFKWTWVDALPGIREGVAAFGLYSAAEWVLAKAYPEPAHGHGNGHGHGHEEHGAAAHTAKSHH